MLKLEYHSLYRTVFAKSYREWSAVWKVVDKFSQQPIPGAVIEINELNIKTGSDDKGNFEFVKIEEGRYTIKIYSVGYVPLLIDNVIVSPGRPYNISAELEPVQTDEIVVESERFIKPIDLTTSYKNLNYEEEMDKLNNLKKQQVNKEMAVEG